MVTGSILLMLKRVHRECLAFGDSSPAVSMQIKTRFIGRRNQFVTLTTGHPFLTLCYTRLRTITQLILFILRWTQQLSQQYKYKVNNYIIDAARGANTNNNETEVHDAIALLRRKLWRPTAYFDMGTFAVCSQWPWGLWVRVSTIDQLTSDEAGEEVVINCTAGHTGLLWKEFQLHYNNCQLYTRQLIMTTYNMHYETVILFVFNINLIHRSFETTPYVSTNKIQSIFVNF